LILLVLIKLVCARVCVHGNEQTCVSLGVRRLAVPTHATPCRAIAIGTTAAGHLLRFVRLMLWHAVHNVRHDATRVTADSTEVVLGLLAVNLVRVRNLQHDHRFSSAFGSETFGVRQFGQHFWIVRIGGVNVENANFRHVIHFALLILLAQTFLHQTANVSVMTVSTLMFVVDHFLLAAMLARMSVGRHLMVIVDGAIGKGTR